jgi:hypothetical protein
MFCYRLKINWVFKKKKKKKKKKNYCTSKMNFQSVWIAVVGVRLNNSVSRIGKFYLACKNVYGDDENFVLRMEIQNGPVSG